MWRVDLSEVQASIDPDGLNDRENMVAGSMPLLNSPIFAVLLVLKTRINVPFRWVSKDSTMKVALCQQHTVSLAVASSPPSGLIVTALIADECAGMMLTVPVSSVTRLRWPGCRPGKAIIFSDIAQRPNRLSVVSCANLNSGFFAKE
jgi:hypothetical protein